MRTELHGSRDISVTTSYRYCLQTTVRVCHIHTHTYVRTGWYGQLSPPDQNPRGECLNVSLFSGSVDPLPV